MQLPTKSRRPIGIVGGLGPAAGIVLQTHLLEKAFGPRDQDHMPTVTVSLTTTPDRTAWLVDPNAADPLPDILKAVSMLGKCGCRYFGIACFTAHYWWPQIAEHGAALKMTGINCIEATVTAAKLAGCNRDHPILLLATTGTVQSEIFQREASKQNVAIQTPAEEDQAYLHEHIIYGEDWGFKASGLSSTQRASRELCDLIARNRKPSFGGVVLGCTELSLATVTDTSLPVIDGLDCMANALAQNYSEISEGAS